MEGKGVEGAAAVGVMREKRKKSLKWSRGSAVPGAEGSCDEDGDVRVRGGEDGV